MDLSPVRPLASTSKKPINPWPTAQRGLGWPTAAYQDGSVTAAKLATPVQNVVNNITRIAPTKMANAQTVTLWSSGVLSLHATCTINSGGSGRRGRHGLQCRLMTEPGRGARCTPEVSRMSYHCRDT